MPGPRSAHGPISKKTRQDSMKVLGRLIGDIFETYRLQMMVVFVGIVVSVLANVQGTMFMQTLIDDYITPMLQKGGGDFGPLANASFSIPILYDSCAF